MARSDSILGRRLNQKIWAVAQKGGKSFAVMAYGYKGGLRFADATWCGPREKRVPATPQARKRHSDYFTDPSAKKIARIRIIVTPKVQK